MGEPNESAEAMSERADGGDADSGADGFDVDEVGLHARLQCPLHGALVHVAHALGVEIGADLTVAHVFDAPGPSRATAAVSLNQLLPLSLRSALQAWPTAGGSLFAHAKAHRLVDRAFLPRQLMPAQQLAAMLPQSSAGPLVDVSDCCCVSVTVNDRTWALFAFLRLDGRPRFAPQAVDLLDRLRPLKAQRLAQALFENGPDVAHPWGELPVKFHNPHLTLDHAERRLSRAERVIFSRLRSDVTEQEVATELHRSVHTVHAHVKSIYRKLGITSRRQLQALFPLQR